MTINQVSHIMELDREEEGGGGGGAWESGLGQKLRVHGKIRVEN